MVRAMGSMEIIMYNPSELFDCHSHILPGIDDGSRNVEESMSMLRKFEEQGVQVIWATPHFYPDAKLEEFLDKRDKAYKELIEEVSVQGEDLPKILKGAEVLLSIDTPQLPDLEKLCIEGTRYILIELPYVNWSEWVYEALYTILAHRGLIPILAHIERYERVVSDISKINRLLEMDVVVQMNAYSLTGSKKALALRLIKNNMIHVLGSDAHRAKTAIGVSEGYALVSKKLGKEVANRLMYNAKVIIENQVIEKLEPKPIKKVLGMYR